MIIVNLLSQQNIIIAALQETRLPGSGHLQEVESGYAYYWIGKSLDEERESGVCFAIRSNLTRQFESLPVGISIRLMLLHGKISKNLYWLFFLILSQLITFS